MDPITSRVYARIGLLGNPSDGFEGACISVSIKNFWAQVTMQKSHLASIAAERCSLAVPPALGCTLFQHTISPLQVTLTPAPAISFQPNPACDPTAFEGPDALVAHLRGCGFYGGVRLMQVRRAGVAGGVGCLAGLQGTGREHCCIARSLPTAAAPAQATCLRFFEYCRTSCVALRPSTPGFSISYTTTIPRQRGLSGSSAICTATLNCLLRHYGVEGAVPVADRPQLLLEAERELGITAGLQDRVIQVLLRRERNCGWQGGCFDWCRPRVLSARPAAACPGPTPCRSLPCRPSQVYGGVVHMDFTAGVMQERERGAYTSLDPSLLPPLHIIYRADGAPGKDSGGVHSDVRQQWLAGNTTVRRGPLPWRPCGAVLGTCRNKPAPSHHHHAGTACGNWRQWRRRAAAHCCGPIMKRWRA